MHLYAYLMLFIQGATLAHYTGDREAKRAEVAAALAAFDVEFLPPSIARRRALLAEVDAGTVDRGRPAPRRADHPAAPTTTTCTCPPDVVLREICFFLLAGAHTSATAFVRTLHHVFAMASEPARRLRAGPHRPGVPPALRARDGPPPAVEPDRHALGAAPTSISPAGCTSPRAPG